RYLEVGREGKNTLPTSYAAQPNRERHVYRPGCRIADGGKEHRYRQRTGTGFRRLERCGMVENYPLVSRDERPVGSSGGEGFFQYLSCGSFSFQVAAGSRISFQ